MDLKTFVSDTLTQIMAGVQDAKDKHRASGSAGAISPQFEVRDAGASEGHTPLFGVEFDVAVTVTEEVGKKGGIGVVAGIFEGGAHAESNCLNQSISRIKFRVPLLLPGIEG